MIVLGIATLSIANTGTATDSAIVQHSTATAAGKYAKAPAVSFLTCLGTTALKEFAAADDSQFLFGDFFFGCFKISFGKLYAELLCQIDCSGDRLFLIRIFYESLCFFAEVLIFGNCLQEFL